MDRAFAPASRFLRDVAGPGGTLLVPGGIRDTDRVHFLPHFRPVVVDLVPAPGVSVRCDAHRLPFRDASMDAAMAQGILNCAWEARRIMTEWKRVARLGGCTCIRPFSPHTIRPLGTSYASPAKGGNT